MSCVTTSTVLHWKGKVKREDQHETEIVCCNLDGVWMLLCHAPEGTTARFYVEKPVLIDCGLFHIPVWLSDTRMIKSKPMNPKEALTLLEGWLPENPVLESYVDTFRRKLCS